MGKLLVMLAPFVMMLGLTAIVFLVLSSIRKRGDAKAQYLYRKDQGVYYFDNGNLVVNIAYPYRPRAVALDEIDHVVFVYDLYSKDIGKYTVGLDIVKKDGATVTGPGVVIRQYVNPFEPEEAARDLEAHGIRCELPTGKGTIFGNRPK